jgi:hypothetical protein
MKTRILILTLATSLVVQSAFAGGLGYQPGDSTKTVLERQAGQQVELHLKSGEKISGKVGQVSDKTVHLTTLTGQEFFEALIVLDDVSVVVVRAAAK